MKTIKGQYRQGDVLLNPRKRAIPEKVERAEENGQAVLAHGEATGHSHAFPLRQPAVALYRDSEGTYLEVKAEAPLKHQEHHAIPVRPEKHGHDVIRQREYIAPEIARNVAD